MGARLPLLTFHTLETARSVIAFPPDLFAEAIRRLEALGYRTVSVLDAAAWARGERAVPERAVVLTFDDGYRTVYEQAFPVLARHGMSATVFLTVGRARAGGAGERLPSLEGRPMLSWGEIREMHRAGVAFGAHTCTHPDLTRLPTPAVEDEVGTSKAIIEDALGAPVACFAYPFGRYDRRVADAVRARFACACSDRLGLISRRSDPHALERVDAYYLRGRRRLGLLTTPLFPWYVRARSVPRGARRAWQRRRAPG